MKLYRASLLRIRDRFYLIDQIPEKDGSKPRGALNEVRAVGPAGQFTYAAIGAPAGTVAVLDSIRTDHVYLFSFGIIPAEQLNPNEHFVPAGKPDFLGAPYVYMGTNAHGLMMGLSPSEKEPIILQKGDFVQPV